jgi:hypothetical protein
LSEVEPSVRLQDSGWKRHFFYRGESVKTTWKLRVLILIVPILALWLTQGFWTVKIAESLVCEEQITPSDAILLDNFDPEYLVFERAAALRRAGVADRVIVPVTGAKNQGLPTTVSEGIAELMARVAHLENIEVVPIEYIEPITLNAGYQLREFLIKENVKSAVVVAPAFRSKRSLLIYDAVLTPGGIALGCAPVSGETDATNWTHTLHGIQEVFLQFGKLQYYRFWVLSYSRDVDRIRPE